jgi:hypothetical protein
MSGWYDDGSEEEFQARRALKSRYYGLEPREYTCAHCSGDMNRNLNCSNGGSCESIEDFDKRKVRELQESISQPNNGFITLEEASKPAILPELTDEILGWYADGRFSEDVKHRGQELAKELLEARLILRGFRAKHGLPLDPPRREI